MAKIVYLTNGMSSTLNSCLELCRRLIADGHELVCMSPVDCDEAFAANGIEFVHLNGISKLKQQFRVECQGQSRLNKLKKRRQYRKRCLTCSEIEETVAQLAPDLLLIDIEMHYAILATRQLGIPTLLPIVWFSLFRAANLPPMHTHLLPSDKLKIRWSWWRLLIARRIGHFMSRFHFKKRTRLPSYETIDRFELISVARARGIDFAKTTDWTQWIRPHLYPGLDIVCFNQYEMEFPHTPPDSIHYVGPMVHQSRVETKVSEKQFQEWQQFHEHSMSNNQPIIYCSLGTYWSADSRFLNKVIDVFREQSEWSLVIGLGSKLTANLFPSLPANVLAMEFAPQLDVLKASRVAITHGGITSINECIQYEVPMLVCSTGHVDQNGCAARVVYHKLGLSIDIDQASVDSIRASLNQLIDEESIRANVARMQSNFEESKSNQVAEKLVRRFVSAKSATNTRR